MKYRKQRKKKSSFIIRLLCVSFAVIVFYITGNCLRSGVHAKELEDQVAPITADSSSGEEEYIEQFQRSKGYGCVIFPHRTDMEEDSPQLEIDRVQ